MMTSMLACFIFFATAIQPPSGRLLPSEFPSTTATKAGAPGDPVNVVLVGTRSELVSAFCAAGWFVSDPITVRSAVRIGVSVALNRPYPAAPVSDLFLFGRAQDVAFEQSVGPSARSRHHVRFWEAGTNAEGRPIWIGAGTFDVKVGRSPATGRLTHRIAANVDAERDTILAALRESGGLAEESLWPRGGPTSGRNGEGDCYYTDGRVAIGILKVGNPTCDRCGPCMRPTMRLTCDRQDATRNRIEAIVTLPPARLARIAQR